MYKILFTGGGSAGHTVPNIAIISDLLRRGGFRAAYIGTNGIEKRLVSATGTPFYEISCPKLVRSFTAKNLKIPFELCKAVRAARAILREIKPDLVFSKGGFVALPVCLAAHKEKIPVLTHESDLSPGLSTRLIAGKCRFVLTSFPETAARFKNGKFTGSPLRAELFEAKRGAKKGKNDRKTLLAFGGGSGATAINRAIFQNLDELTKVFSIVHILGEKNVAAAPAHAHYTPLAYAENMGEAYANANVVLARAGSNTLFEIAALKIPALIVPLEKNSRGDQKENADYFFSKGLISVASENTLSQNLCAKLQAVLADEAMKSALETGPFSKSGNEKIIAAVEETLRENQK